MSAQSCDDNYLLSDDEIVDFLTNGYKIITPTCPPTVHAAVTAQADAHDAARDRQITGSADTPHAEVQRQQDLFASVPALDDVVRDPRVQGALTSLLGPRYKLQTHRTNHCKRPYGDDQDFHVDGQFRNLDAGWFRNYRRWHRIRKLLCFYYPHDVTTAPSAVIPGSQYLSTLTDQQRRDDGMFLFVPAGSFVLLHYSMWHRGSEETKGERRIMLKLLFDRTEQPIPGLPSWNHDGTIPRWSQDMLDKSPWVPSIYHWMAGLSTPPSTLLAQNEIEELFACLTHGLDNDSVAAPQDQPSDSNGEWKRLRAAYKLGHSADPWLASRCIDELERAAECNDIGAEIWLSNAVVAFGSEVAGPELLRRAWGQNQPAHLRTLLLDTLMDCGTHPADTALALRLFAKCLDDEEEWVRYAGLTALEQAALSALFYTAAEPRRWQTELEEVASTHEHPMVAWKAAEIVHMVRNGLEGSCGKPAHQARLRL